MGGGEAVRGSRARGGSHPPELQSTIHRLPEPASPFTAHKKSLTASHRNKLFCACLIFLYSSSLILVLSLKSRICAFDTLKDCPFLQELCLSQEKSPRSSLGLEVIKIWSLFSVL